jgi:hypothetical protein
MRRIFLFVSLAESKSHQQVGLAAAPKGEHKHDTMRDLTQAQAVAVFATTAAIVITAFAAVSLSWNAPSPMAVERAGAPAADFAVQADQAPRSSGLH